MTAHQIPCPRLASNPRSEGYEFFMRQVTSYFEIADIASETKQLQVLLYSLGRDELNVFDGFSDPKDTYREATDRLRGYFSGNTSILLRRKEFYALRQSPTETVTELSCKLRRFAKECDFGPSMHTMLRDIFVIGIKDDNLGERLLSEDASKLISKMHLKRQRHLSGPEPTGELLLPKSASIQCRRRRREAPKCVSGVALHCIKPKCFLPCF